MATENQEGQNESNLKEADLQSKNTLAETDKSEGSSKASVQDGTVTTEETQELKNENLGKSSGEIATSSVVNGTADSATADAGGRELKQPTSAAMSSAAKEPTGADRTGSAADTGSSEAEHGGSANIIVKEEPVVKQEPPDSEEATTSEAVPDGVLDTSPPAIRLGTQESEAFTPATVPFAPEAEQQERQTSSATAAAPGRSATSARGVKIVKETSAPSGRRSSSYLYNDWDRTLYEKTGRPPPGEAHWTHEKSSHHARSPSRLSGVDTRPQSRSSGQPSARSPSARPRRSHSRPATSPCRRPFNMAHCQRETQDQFGRRILYRHCFVEPEFTLRGQRIPVRGARKGSIIAAEDTYASYALEMVTPPAECQLSAQKVQRRRKRTRKKRRKRIRRSPSAKSAKRERQLIEEQWQKLEEEAEKLGEDRMRLEETRWHLEQLDEWWQTEGLLVLQRDEMRAKEERILNAAIEEERLRINDERTRIQQEWQFLLERMALQEKDEIRIREETSALEEMEEELTQKEETDIRRMQEMRAVFEIERRMMEVDRKKLVNDALTCDAFQNALEDAALGGWGAEPDEFRSNNQARSATDIGDIINDINNIVGIKNSGLAVPEPIRSSPIPAVPDPVKVSFEEEQHSPAPPESDDNRPPKVSFEAEQRSSTSPDSDDDGRPSSVDSDATRQQAPRPITARGRPVRISRSMPSGSTMAADQTKRPLSAARSDGAGVVATGADTFSGAGGETIDVWRRRPTILQRNDISSEVLVADKENQDGNRDESSSRAPSIAFTMPGEPAHGERPRSASTGQYAKSEGYVGVPPRIETQKRPLSSAPVLPFPDTASERARPKHTVPRDMTQVHSETEAGTVAASSGTSQQSGHDQAAPMVRRPSVETSAANVSGASEDQSQPGSPPSSPRNEDTNQRHVSFSEATAQPLTGEADDGDGDED